MRNPLIYEDDRKRLTPYEIDKLYEVTHRVQPACPGCGQPMSLFVQTDVTDGRWFVSYICDGSTGCGVWQTQSIKGRGAGACVEDAWKTAMRRAQDD